MTPPKPRTEVLLVLAAAALFAGCSARDGYHAGQNWQRTECNRMLEPERSRCLASIQDDYDTYRKKRDGTY